MNKKYELIADGANKRIKALRSFKVQDRYVNIGDVGGIVYDEKTLSQDGNAWIFKGNMGSPTIRVSGDAIVDITEGTVSGSVKALLTIDGQSKVVGAAANLNVRTSNTAWELTPDMFEQGNFDYTAGINWETWKRNSVNYVRLKQPIYVGGATGLSLAVLIAGFAYQLYFMDRDGVGIAATAGNVSGPGVNISIPATAVYMTMRITKDPLAATVPADIATAKPTLSNGTVEGYFLIRDSAITITNTVAGTAAFRITQTGPGVNGTSVPGSSIVNSTVNIYKPGNLEPSLLIATDMVNTNATITTTAATNYDLLGVYDNVKNLMVTSELGIQRGAAGAETIITAKDCQDFTYSSTVFPGAAAAQTANRPFRFVRCNVPNGIFYNHPQIENTYTDIDFSLASANLGKTFSNNHKLASSEVPGMYRVVSSSGVVGLLVESFASVTRWGVYGLANSYNVTIYADAYLSGQIEMGGTLVLGGTRKHDQAQPIGIEGRAVQGMLNTLTVGEKITGVNDANDRVSLLTPFRAGGPAVIGVLAPDSIETLSVGVDAKNAITVVSAWAAGDKVENAPAWVSSDKVYFAFRRKGGGLLKPEDLKDVSVVEYHGCKIINTNSAKVINLKGNIRVEDDAHLINASVEGSGYFGGRSTTSNANIIGSAYMDDNAVYANGEVAEITDLEMRDNAHYEGMPLESIISLTMYDNSACYGTVDLLNGSLFMMGNAEISADATVDAVGSLVMKDNAIVDSTLNTSGRIVLQGGYNQATRKTWMGCRNIDSENAPVYGGNVKTRHDYF